MKMLADNGPRKTFGERRERKSLEPSPEEGATAEELEKLGLVEWEARAAAPAVVRARARRQAVENLSETMREGMRKLLEHEPEVRKNPKTGAESVWIGELRVGANESAEGAMVSLLMKQCASQLNFLSEEDLDLMPKMVDEFPEEWTRTTSKLQTLLARQEIRGFARQLPVLATVQSGISRQEMAELFAQAWDHAQLQHVHEEDDGRIVLDDGEECLKESYDGRFLDWPDKEEAG